MFLLVFVPYILARSAKAFHCLRSGETYILAGWDGGVFRAGYQLNERGMRHQLGVSALQAALVASGLARILLPELGFLLLLVTVVIQYVMQWGGTTSMPRDPDDGWDA